MKFHIRLRILCDVSALQSRFKFLKQYLTVNRSEIFFADKIILFEGETDVPEDLQKKYDISARKCRYIWLLAEEREGI